MMGEIAKIKQPNESLYREENVLLCAAFSAAPFLLKTIMKRLLREITAGRTCFSPSYKYTHTQNSLVTFFPMTAWEFLCSGVTAQCEMQREKVCVCVNPVRGAGPEVARSLERRCLLCSFKLHRETERG